MGELLVQVTKKSHSDNLLRITNMVNIPVKVTPHVSLNTVKGVIREFDLLYTEEAEILSDLSDQGVVRTDGAVSRGQASRITGSWVRIPQLPSDAGIWSSICPSETSTI